MVYFLQTDEPVYLVEFGHSELDRTKRVGPYVRSTYILHYVLSGTCHFDGFEANAGDAFLISKNKLHSFWVESGYRHIWMAFDGNGAADLLKSFGISPDEHTLLKVADTEFANAFVENAKAYVLSSSDVKTAKSWLYAMLPLLSSPAVKPQTVRHDVTSAAHILEQHYHRSITMQQVAEMLHISEKHFCKVFKKQYGIPPQEFLINIRMQKAKQLLKTTNLRIKEVAGSVGFSSQLNFSAAFKKRFNQSPTEYRINR